LLVEKKKFEDPDSIRFREKYNNPNETNSYWSCISPSPHKN
jgi:hypothetical protein